MNFKVGGAIISEGDKANSAFLIISGEVEVTIGEVENVKTVESFKKGDVFGEKSLIELAKRTATVTAVTDTECIEAPTTTSSPSCWRIQRRVERCSFGLRRLRTQAMRSALSGQQPGALRLRAISR